jgi:glyoxylase-like metal-dependent hydrolase (beta-lactamase superfamily II)
MRGFIFAAALMALVAAPPAAAQFNVESTPIKPELIRNGVYIFYGAGGNIGVSVGKDGVLIVDSQFAGMTQKIDDAIKAITDAPFRYVLNTHWHFDHTGGNENFGKAGKVIIAHDNTRVRMSKPAKVLNFDQAASDPAALPVVTFGDTATVHFNGLTAHLVHLPNAHTDTDALVHFREADIIHTGDVYTRGTYPFVDVASGGSLRGMIAARKRILALCGPNTVIIPGHGTLSTPAELKASIVMLEEMERRVTNAIAAGKSLADLLAENPTADFDKDYAPRPDQGKVFVTRAYEDLARFVAKKKS